MSKIPFSMEYRPLIESGEYKVEIGREDPWPARIVCWDLNGDNIIAVVMNPEGREEGLIYTKQGKHNAICPRIDSDLFIIIPEPDLTESEDERIRKELKEAFEAYDIESTWNGIPIRSIFAWLEKKKEWSEEDERILKGIIGLVDHDQHYGVSNKEMIDWLRFLRPRPHWKPSEEQIRALERAIVRFNSVDDIPILTELRDKLKKL